MQAFNAGVRSGIGTPARAYGRGPMTTSMLPFLATAARRAREQAGRLQVHIAAEAHVTETTIARFEARRGWPRDPDRIVNAYARDLDLNAADLWREAVELWQQEP